MLRFGITSLDDLCRAEDLPAREVSAPLLWAALHRDPERWGAACRAAFNRMRMGNGVYKYTTPHRFDDIADALLGVLASELGAHDPLLVHDLGVSDGTTSVELYDELRGRWKNVRLTMSDFFDALYVVRLDGSPWRCVLDATLTPVQYVSRRFVLSPQRPPGWRLPWNAILLRGLQRDLGPRAVDAATRSDLSVDPPRCPPGVAIERILMLSKACVDLLDRDPAVRFVRHDVLAPLEGRFHLVRAMNVLNLSYFGAEKLGQAIRHVRDALYERGLLVVGRCIDEEDGRSATTVYRREDRRLFRVTGFSGGSELESLIEAVS